MVSTSSRITACLLLTCCCLVRCFDLPTMNTRRGSCLVGWSMVRSMVLSGAMVADGLSICWLLALVLALTLVKLILGLIQFCEELCETSKSVDLWISCSATCIAKNVSLTHVPHCMISHVRNCFIFQPFLVCVIFDP